MDCEHGVRVNSQIECRCAGCGDGEDCLCQGLPYARRCEECRRYEDLGLGLAWLGAMIDRHEPKGGKS
jgi:hypothetical protein